jgi:AraC-like DNA-binding protein
LERLNRHPDDSLSEALRAARVHSTVFCLSDLRAPWGFHVESSPVAKFHLVLEGACELTLDGGEHAALEAGDLVLLPQGSGHTVRDGSDSSVCDLEELLADRMDGDGLRLYYGGSGQRTRLLCGGYTLAGALPDGLLAMLTRIIRLNVVTSGLGRWLEPLFVLLREEADSALPGADAILAKLADVFLAQTVRSYVAGSEGAGLSRLAPLADPVIARAVGVLRTRPREAWTVGRLAREAGMSRTLFAARFHKLVGESPIRFLTALRMSLAAGHLATTNETVFAIGHSVGYESEASFSKAFKREFGRSPADFRRDKLARPIPIDSAVHA